MILAAAGVVVGIAALMATALTGAASADTPTATPSPTPSPTPTVSPTATPYPKSTITIRFVDDSEPVEVFLWTPVHRIFADGESCNIPISQIAGYFPGYTTVWPLAEPGFLAEPCTKPPPTSITVEFNAQGTILSTDLLWLGEDLTIEFDVSPFVAESPSPTASPSILPPTGGRPATLAIPFTVVMGSIISFIISCTVWLAASKGKSA